MTAYAGIDDLLALFETKPKPDRQTDRLEPLLETATDELIDELGGLDFFRHPSTGSETWLTEGDGSRLLHVHQGLVALDLVEISLDLGRTFIALGSDDWVLQWNWYSSHPPREGEPWFHLRLRPLVSPSVFPCGMGTVRLTGATGWPAIPRAGIEGVAERARQIAYADPSYEGVIPSDDSYGQPIVTGRWPDVTWKLIQREKQRFMTCGL